MRRTRKALATLALGLALATVTTAAAAATPPTGTQDQADQVARKALYQSELERNLQLRTQAGNVSVGAAAGVSASLDAGTSYGRIDNALKNTDGAADLNIHATTAYGDIAARSL